MADAEVNYQQSLLAVLFEQQYVSIGRAVKYQDRDGKKRLKLSLVNASGGTEEFQKLIGINDDLFRHLQPDVISSIYVSVYNNDGSIISQPYEVKVQNLRAGKPREVDFGLLQDLDAVTVNIIYGNGSSRTLKIVLQKDNTANAVAVQSQQFSQEAELGKTATFDLTLELYSGVNNTFSLEVLNLPEQINRTFRDVATSARMTQIKFTESSNSRKAAPGGLAARPAHRTGRDGQRDVILRRRRPGRSSGGDPRQARRTLDGGGDPGPGGRLCPAGASAAREGTPPGPCPAALPGDPRRWLGRADHRRGQRRAPAGQTT